MGKRLAKRLDMPFVDADSEIFEHHGEQAFRDGERRVIARLLDQPAQVLATGGGAYMDPRTRALTREKAISIWLRADRDLLLRRTSRRNNRPLLKKGDPAKILERLIVERYPIYAEADITVDTQDGPPERTLDAIMTALEHFLKWQASEVVPSALGKGPAAP